MELPADPVRPGEPRGEATRLPALARYWWLTAVRGPGGADPGPGHRGRRAWHRPPGDLPRPLLDGRRADHAPLRPRGAPAPQLGRRWTIGGVVLGTLEAALGVLLLASTDIRPEVIGPVAAAWGVVSGSLLLAEGVRLRRFARAT